MKPILFNTEMVRAILKGRKTQTRRVIPEKVADAYYDYDDWCNAVAPRGVPCIRDREKSFFLKRAKYQPGDILWVRETTYLYGRWAKNGLTKTGKQKYKFVWDKSQPVIYAADNKPDVICTKKDQIGYFKRPSIFMPRDAARIFLRVKTVRVERLQEITEEDARAEGVNGIPRSTVLYPNDDYIYPFKQLWNSLNKKRGYGWDVNPWVWVYEFERVSEDGSSKDKEI